MSRGLNDTHHEVGWEAKFWPQISLDPKKATQFGELRIRFGFGQTFQHIGLRDIQFFRRNQGVDHPAHGITEPLVAAHCQRRQRFFAENGLKDGVGNRCGEP